MAAGSGGALARATECKIEGKGVSFYLLSMEEMIHGGLAAVAQCSRSLTASHDLTRASPAPRSSPKASP
jgi:hypothetical protein